MVNFDVEVLNEVNEVACKLYIVQHWADPGFPKGPPTTGGREGCAKILHYRPQTKFEAR